MPGLTWDDVAPTPENGYPNSDHLLPSALALTIVMVVLRYLVVEPFVIKPFGRAIGLKEHTYKKPPSCMPAEALFLSHRGCKVPQSEVVRVAYEIGWSERQVERWLRLRRVAESSSKMFKLCDCSWQLLYYIAYCIYGIFVMKDKPWFWDIKLCWTDFPFQSVPDDVWWYYMIPLGYYTAMSLTFVIQHQRKDALQMILHHIITIFLIVLSFAVNMIREGSLILFVHEVADIPLLLAKICGYAGFNSAMDYLFVIFILTWVATRLFLFPFWILKNSIFEAHITLNTMYPIYYIFNGLLLLLLGFHAVWTYLIIQMVVKKLKTKKVRDLRSDSEEISEDSKDDFTEEAPLSNSVLKDKTL
ncbi:UNVERIFIED_CONTAM: hypothetical protein GTU68_021093 [Idotea baltica]|nr:hypothetical protein [Idotea baltica]